MCILAEIQSINLFNCKFSVFMNLTCIDNYFIHVPTEDNKLIVIVLVKSSRLAENCWHSLLKDQYTADPYIYDQMEKKLTLQRFQHEVRGTVISNGLIKSSETIVFSPIR